MAEEEEPEDGEEESGGGAGGGKLLLIIGLVNAIGLAGLAAFVVLGNPGAAPMTPESASEAAEFDQASRRGRANQGEPGPMMELGSLVVNLREPNAERYLKCKLQLELDSEDTRAEVEGRLSQIRLQLTMLLSGQRVADVTGPEAMEALRKAMIRRVNAQLNQGRVMGVWPDEWIVQ
jgi:flagellar protein FliL